MGIGGIDALPFCGQMLFIKNELGGGKENEVL